MAKYTTNKLSDPDLKAAKPKEKRYSLSDGGGLRFFITPKGVKSWRYIYRIAGKSKTLTIGNYPTIGLKQARELCSVARNDLDNGVDPAIKKQVAKNSLENDSFQAVAEAWIDHNSEGWSATHKQRTESYLRRDVFKVIGSRRLDDIAVQDLILIVKTVASRGAVDSARRLMPLMGQVLEFGIVHGSCSRNPSRDVSIKSLGLPKTIPKGYAAIIDPAKLAHLLRTSDDYAGNLSAKVALQLAPMLGMRPTELTSGEWSELDLDAGLWTLPAKRRKLPKHLKEANRPEDAHLVPLPKQAIELLRDLHDYTGRGKYLFPGLRGDSRPISNNTLRAALRGMGFSNDDHTPHGYRHTISTMLNNMGYRERIIEAQLSHALKSQVEAAYNRSSYIEERTKMMQEWADYLDGLKAGADVIPISKKQV